jgi:hypothetical protein
VAIPGQSAERPRAVTTWENKLKITADFEAEKQEISIEYEKKKVKINQLQILFQEDE